MPTHPPIPRWIVPNLATRLWPVQVEGRGSIPPTGAAILAANHLSFFDSVALLLASPRPVAFLGKAEYLHDWKTARLFTALGMIPVDRASRASSARALEGAAAVLDGGGLFAIYPEGTRSPDGRLQPGRCGVAQLSITTGAPVIPVGILGTDRIQPPGARVPRPGRTAVVRIGAPVHPDGYGGTARQRRRALTTDVMDAIATLIDQEPAPERPSISSPARTRQPALIHA